MKIIRLLFMFLLLYTYSSCNLFSQKPYIANTKFILDKSLNQVIITYDLKDYSESDVYEVELIFYDGKNPEIRPKSVSGDIGQNVKGGENKKISWNIFEDVVELSETSRPVITITSIRPIPIDPSLALIMNKIDKAGTRKFDFKIKREGVLLLGIGAGISAVALRIKGNNYIDQQNRSTNIDDYKVAGDKAQSCYTFSWISGGLSTICVGYALYRYLWADKSQLKKYSLYLSPNTQKGVSIALRYNFI
jgi:hypothetical protein